MSDEDEFDQDFDAMYDHVWDRIQQEDPLLYPTILALLDVAAELAIWNEVDPADFAEMIRQAVQTNSKPGAEVTLQ